MVAITSNKREHILGAVTQMYTQVANSPRTEFHFPTGRKACEFVRYPAASLDGLPPEALESFAGVGNPFAVDAIKKGDAVLDIGSGSGTDVLIAQRRVGTRGKVYALDMTAAMRTKLQGILDANGIRNVEIIEGNAESIPLGDATVDVVTSNGVLNLVPDKARAIAEIFRVLRPGGRLQLADIALRQPIAPQFKNDPNLWAECVVGAVSEERYLEMFRAAGLQDVGIVDHFDYFAGSNSDKTREVANLFGAHSVVLRASKPAGAELRRIIDMQASWRRRGLGTARQLLAIGGAGIAVAVCSGVPLLVGAFGAVGAAAFATHAYMFPLFVACVAVASFGLYREGTRRGNLAPFWIGAISAAVSSVVLWIMITNIIAVPLWTLIVPLVVLLAASVWCLLLPLQVDQCLKDMIRSVAARERPRRVQFSRGAAISLAAAAAFYGMYKSVDAFVPKAEASAIACYGINACKGQTACATAHNACPGQNSCKGKGFLNVPADECTERGGQPLKGSPADPASR